MKNKIIANEIEKIIAQKGLVLVSSEKYINSINYEAVSEDLYNQDIQKYNFNNIYKVDLHNFDFFGKQNIQSNTSKEISIILSKELELDLLSNLLEKELLPLDKIKKITFDGISKNYRSWNDLKHLFLYNDYDISAITKKYDSSINNYDLNDIFIRITKNNNAVENILAFTENHLDRFKSNHLNFIHDFMIKNATDDELNNFEKILKKNGKWSQGSDLFEEKENKFEFLNLNVELFMKKYYLALPENKVASIDEYEKVVKDTLSFLKSNKKKLNFENIYFENRANTKNEFLINIETKDGFNKEVLKKVFLEYVKIYVEELSKVSTQSNWTFLAKTKMLENKEKITNFIFFNMELDGSANKKSKSMKI